MVTTLPLFWLYGCQCNRPSETDTGPLDSDETDVPLALVETPQTLPFLGGSRPSFVLANGTTAFAWQDGTPPTISVGWNSGKGWQTEPVVGTEALGAWNPAVTITSSQTPLVAWQDYRAGDADLYTWSSSTTVRLDTDEAGTNNSVFPVLSVGPSGQIAAVWTDNREDDLGILFQAWTSLFASVTTDGGLTWSEGRVDSGPYTEAPSVQPTAAWDDAGRLYVAFLDSRGGPYALRLNRSDDDGASFWTDDLSITAGPALHPRVDAASEGAVALVWEQHTESLPSVMFASSTDGGENFGLPVRLNAGTGAARDPVLWFDDDFVAVAWSDFSNNAPDVHVAVSTDGVTFTETALGDDTPGTAASLDPVVARLDADTLAVAWLDGRSGALVPTVAISIDEGASWDEIGLNSADSSDMRIASTGPRTLLVAWREVPASGMPRLRLSEVSW